MHVLDGVKFEDASFNSASRVTKSLLEIIYTFFIEAAEIIIT